MFEDLITFVAEVWHADSQMRQRSLLGESEMDRRSRRVVAWLCGGVIAILTLGAVAWWWINR